MKRPNLRVASRALPRPLFDAIYEMNAAPTHADFLSAIMAGLGQLIASDLCIIHVLDRRRQRVHHRMAPANPYIAAEIDYYTAHSGEHPLFLHYQRTGETCARRITDVISLRAWLACPNYLHCHARLGEKFLLVLPVSVDADTIASISFNRKRRNFTVRERTLLDAFAPHFRLAWKRQKDPWQAGAEFLEPRADEALTARESDVLYWITAGKQNREIGLILGITLFTVQKHVANILRKVHAENRHSLTVLTLNRAAGR